MRPRRRALLAAALALLAACSFVEGTARACGDARETRARVR
jgi:type IV pilus biogenesis protein CpaD/CtpE